MKEKIKAILTKLFGWLKEEDKQKHMAVGLGLGFFFGFFPAFWAGVAAEYKDWAWNGYKGGKLGFLQGNGFDYYDLMATIIAGVVGHLLRSLFI